MAPQAKVIIIDLTEPNAPATVVTLEDDFIIVNSGTCKVETDRRPGSTEALIVVTGARADNGARVEQEDHGHGHGH